MLILFAIIIIVFLVVSSLNSNRFEEKRQLAKANMETILDSTSLPGQLVSESNEDRGCDKNTTGLETNFSCRIVAEKIYKASKKTITSQQINEAIKDMSWARLDKNQYRKELNDSVVTLSLVEDINPDQLKEYDISLTNDEGIYMAKFVIFYYSD